MRARGLIVFGVFTWALLSGGLLTGAQAQQSRHTVLIDAAHGGEDMGVIGDGIREKDVSLKLALLIRDEMKKSANLQAQMTRSSDVTLTIAERVKAAATTKAECVISLHVNAGFAKKAAGYELYFPGFAQNAASGGESAAILKDMAKNRHLNDSVRLGQQLQGRLESVFPRKGRGLRDAPSPLLEGMAIPGVVVEVGFSTHPEDRKKLLDPGTQKVVAAALVKGLQNYFQKAP